MNTGCGPVMFRKLVVVVLVAVFAAGRMVLL